MVMAHGEIYAEQFGWTTEFEALVARIVADYATEHDPAREAAWIAEVTLWTNDILTSARRIYEAYGFVLTDEEKHHSFGHDLVGQTWTLDLRP